MQIRIKLERLGSLGSEFPLELYYETPNGVKAIDSHYEYITEQEYTAPQNAKQPHKITFAIKEQSKVMSFDFSGKNESTSSEKYKNYLKQQRLYDMIINHPFVETDTRPASKKAEIKVVDEDAAIRTEVAKIKKRLQVANFVNNLKEEGLVGLSAWLNKPVVSMDFQHIYVEMLKDKKTLTDKRGHIAIVDGWAFEDMDKTLAIKTDPRAEIKIIVNKAVILGEIKLESNGYYYGGALIASSDEELYKYFTDNKDYFEKGLKNKVFEKDGLPVNINNYTSATESSGVTTEDLTKTDMGEVEAARREGLLARAKELNVIGNLNKFKNETLEEKIREKELRLSNNESELK